MSPASSSKSSVPSGRLLHLLYHELRTAPSRYSYVTETAMFERHVDLYGRLVSGAGKVRPEITFDDGHISNHDLAAPILESRRLTATFFITAGWTGTKAGYMGWPELQSLHAAGHRIGAHGWSHKLLTHCSDRELERELRDARVTLEDKLGTAIRSMSLPGGRSDARILAACSKAGYDEIYTSVPEAESLPLGPVIGRLNVLGDMQPEWIETLFADDGTLIAELGRKQRRKDALKKLLGDKLYAKLWAMVNRQEPDVEEGASE
jgi:peptidoglycan/xylan/chitin deacetylase (PgdA/CDA1 family)